MIVHNTGVIYIMIVIYSYSNMIFAPFGPAICDEEQHSQDLKKAGWMTPVDLLRLVD